jgi:hypothetical protein
MREHAQFTAEFMVVMIALLMIFLLSVYVFWQKSTSFMFVKHGYDAKYLSEKLARKINEVFLTGDGTQTTVVLEKRIDGNITVQGQYVVVRWRGQTYSVRLLTDNVTMGTIDIGTQLRITNSNGVITVEEV